MQITTRAEARETGAKRFFTGEACIHGHISERDTKEGKCVECVNGRNKQAHRDNAETRNANRRHRRLVDEDYAEYCRRAAREYAAKNMKERVAYVKQWRLDNPTKRREYHVTYAKKHGSILYERTKETRKKNPLRGRVYAAARRSRKQQAEGNHTVNDVLAIYHRQGMRCAVCEIQLHNRYHVDHIMPLARGGSNWPSNIQITCGPCNSQKNARDPIEFMQSRGNLI